MPRQIEAEREAVPVAGGAGAIASAGCMAPGGGAPRGNRNARKHGEFAAETLAMKKTNQRPRSAGPRDNGRDRIARRALAPVRSTGVRAPGASAHIRSSSLKRRSHRTASAAVKPEAIALTGSWRAESFLRRRLGTSRRRGSSIRSWSTHTGPVNAAIWANYATPTAAIIGGGDGRADNSARGHSGGHSARAPAPASAAPAPAPAAPAASPSAPPHFLDLRRDGLFNAGRRREGESCCRADLRRDHRDSRNCARKRASLTSHTHSSFQGSFWDHREILICVRFRQGFRMLY